jgi:HD-like signal output (HDOD) protein
MMRASNPTSDGDAKQFRNDGDARSTKSRFATEEILRVAQDLPAGPRLLVEIGQLIRNPNVSAASIIALLRQDASLVARILRVANSAAYGRVEPVGSIEEAVARVGFGEVHRQVGVVASMQLGEQSLTLYGIDGALMRMNALFVAVTMESLAEECGEEPSSCYTVGLLRSVGKMALELWAKGNHGEVSFRESGYANLDEWEISTWGLSNCEVAETLLTQWRLQRETARSIRYHYRPEGKHSPVIHLLKLAAAAAEANAYGLPGEGALLEITPDNFVRAGLDELSFKKACDRAERTFERLQLHAAMC